jgi:DNA-binding transcriptional MerR regulator
MKWELKKDFTISEIKEICRKNDWGLCGHTQDMIMNKRINKFIERYGDKHLPLKIIEEFYTKKTEDDKVKVGDLCYFYDDVYLSGSLGILDSIDDKYGYSFIIRLGDSSWENCEPIKTHIKKLKKLCKESESKKNDWVWE